MAQDVDVQRKLRQLDGDVTSIYEMFSTISATQRAHGRKFDELSARLDGHDELLRDHGRQLRNHGQQLRDHGEQLRNHGQRLERMDLKLDTVIDLLGGPGPR